MFCVHFIGRIVNLRSILEIYDITFVEDTQVFNFWGHLSSVNCLGVKSALNFKFFKMK